MTSVWRSCEILDLITNILVKLNNFDPFLRVQFGTFCNIKCTCALAGHYWQCVIACLGWSNVTPLRITQVTAIERQESAGSNFGTFPQSGDDHLIQVTAKAGFTVITLQQHELRYRG